jgi:hypothetical protein
MASVDQPLNADCSPAFGPPARTMLLPQCFSVLAIPPISQRNGYRSRSSKWGKPDGPHLKRFGSATTAPEQPAPMRRARSATSPETGKRPGVDHAAVMTIVAPSNERPWCEELALLWTAERHKMAALPESVVAEEFQERVLIGDDGILSDGPQRLEVARPLGISVPVEFVGKEAQR